jgi:hypothetical protein
MDANGKRILNLILTTWRDADWTLPAQDKDHWRSFVDTALITGVSWIRGIYWLDEELSASEEGLCFVVLRAVTAFRDSEIKQA